MISLSGVAASVGARVLFRDVSLRIPPGSRTAVVGPNGAGKTTLLSIVAGTREPDAGEVRRATGTTVGMLPQEVAELAGRTVVEEVVAGSDLAAVEARMRELEPRLGEDDDVVAEYGRLQSRFEQLGGYALDAEARRILAGLGFSEERAERDVGELSGGWMMRVVLARLLLSRPDVLLLDEPTNHLDLESVTWVEDFLRTYEGAVVLVSHDRDLMDRVATRVVELGFGTATEYAGTYTDFLAQREARTAGLLAARKQQDREVERLERFIARFRAKKDLASRVQAKISYLDRMERIEVPEEHRRPLRFRFPEPPRSGRVVVTLDGVRKAYGDTVVYDGVDLVLERGQKVALVGPNGAGKSTLLKLLAGVVEPDAGTRVLGHDVGVAYYAQHQVDALDLFRTVLDELAGALDTRRVRPRDLLGAFLFSGDDVEKRVGVLSGGEKARLALAKLMAEPANLLCMDEPTNHLDIPSRDVVEEALVAYPGTVVLITHDRHLIRAVADTVLAVRDGTVTTHLGGWDAYLGAPDGRPPEAAASPEPPSSPAPRDVEVGRKRAEAERRNARYRATKPLRERLELVESQLERAEAEVAEITRLLADPAVYDDDRRVKELVARHGAAKDRAQRLFADWEDAAVALERATDELAEDEAETGAG